MTRQELSHRTSPQPSYLLCDLFGENINRAFLPLPGLREGVLEPEWVVIVHSEFCISLNPVCSPEHLTIYFSFMGEEKVLRAISVGPLNRPCSAEGLCLDAIRSPCCLATHELEASLTLMDPVILSQCQGVLLRPVLVLRNYQACLTGEGCFNLVLWGLSLDDPGSTVPCVVSVSFQRG